MIILEVQKRIEKVIESTDLVFSAGLYPGIKVNFLQIISKTILSRPNKMKRNSNEEKTRMISAIERKENTVQYYCIGPRSTAQSPKRKERIKNINKKT